MCIPCTRYNTECVHPPKCMIGAVLFDRSLQRWHWCSNPWQLIQAALDILTPCHSLLASTPACWLRAAAFVPGDSAGDHSEMMHICRRKLGRSGWSRHASASRAEPAKHVHGCPCHGQCPSVGRRTLSVVATCQCKLCTCGEHDLVFWFVAGSALRQTELHGREAHFRDQRMQTNA